MVLFFKIKQIQFVTIRKYFADKQKEKIKHIEQDYLLKKVTWNMFILIAITPSMSIII